MELPLPPSSPPPSPAASASKPLAIESRTALMKKRYSAFVTSVSSIKKEETVTVLSIAFSGVYEKS